MKLHLLTPQYSPSPPFAFMMSVGINISGKLAQIQNAYSRSMQDALIWTLIVAAIVTILFKLQLLACCFFSKETERNV